MKIFCYGDSNTYGYDPRGFMGGRYDRVWTDILAEAGHAVTVDALPGRQTPFKKRPLEIMRAQFQERYDLLIIMMGSNDLDVTHSVPAVCERIKIMLQNVRAWDVADRILLVAPPLNKWSREMEDFSLRMNEALEDVARAFDAAFADAGQWDFELAHDRCHLTENDQEIFARELLKAIEYEW